MVYEPSIRVPLILRGPGVPAGARRRQLVTNADLAPTILEAAGARARPRPGRRVAVRPAGDGGLESGRELLLEGPGGVRAVAFSALRNYRFTYAEHENGARELYDLQRDPDQLGACTPTRRYDAIQARLAQRLAALQVCAGASCRARPKVTPQPARVLGAWWPAAASRRSSSAARAAFATACARSRRPWPERAYVPACARATGAWSRSTGACPKNVRPRRAYPFADLRRAKPLAVEPQVHPFERGERCAQRLHLAQEIGQAVPAGRLAGDDAVAKRRRRGLEADEQVSVGAEGGEDVGQVGGDSITSATTSSSRPARAWGSCQARRCSQRCVRSGNG